MRLQLPAVLPPLALAHKGIGQLPARAPVVHFVGYTGVVVGVAVQAHKAELRILLPVPVGGQVGEAAPARFAQAQGLQGAQVVGHVRESAHAPPWLQGPGAHFDVAAVVGAPHIGVRHGELATVGRIFRRHIVARRGFYQLKSGAEIAPFGLKPHHVLDFGLGGQQGFGQVQQLQIAPVVDPDTSLRIHVGNALRHAGQRAFEGARLLRQQRAGAREFHLNRAARQLGSAGHFQLAHGVEQGLEKLHVCRRIPLGPIGQAHHGHQFARRMDGQPQVGVQRGMARGRARAARVVACIVGEHRLARHQRRAHQGLQVVEHHAFFCVLGIEGMGGLVPTDVRHRMHPQEGMPVGGTLYLAHQAKGTLRERHQLLEQGLERGARARTGDEHGLRERYRLQQPVLARQHGLCHQPGTGAGTALQHRIDLRGQGQQVVQRRVLHSIVIKAVAQGLGRMGLGALAHDDHGRDAIEQPQQVKGRAIDAALRRQHNVRPAVLQVVPGLRQRLSHIHPPAGPGVCERIHHRLRVVVIAFDQQDGDGHGRSALWSGPTGGVTKGVTARKHYGGLQRSGHTPRAPTPGWIHFAPQRPLACARLRVQPFFTPSTPCSHSASTNTSASTSAPYPTGPRPVCSSGTSPRCCRTPRCSAC